MKTVVLALALAACTQSVDVKPDADIRAARPDAAPDGQPPEQQNGCAMGNLPTSRTLNFTTADPIRPAFLNEVQDNIIGAKAPASDYIITANHFKSCFGAPQAPQRTLGEFWSFQTGAANEITYGLELRPGTSVNLLEFHYNRNGAGAAAGEFIFEVWKSNLTTQSAVSNLFISTGGTAATADLIAHLGAPMNIDPGWGYFLVVHTDNNFVVIPTFSGVRMNTSRL